MKTITASELKDWQAESKEFTLLDVREDHERAQFNIGGLHIPLGNLAGNTGLIPGNLPLVVYCERGIRSVIAMQRLETLGFTDMYNLTGGMKEWKKLNP